MNKRYMDFVPVNTAERVRKKPTKRVVSGGRKAEDDAVVEKVMAVKETKPRAGVSVGKSGPKYNSAAELQAKFVKTEVKKRPLSKNVYQKKVATTAPEKEIKEPAEPVTIISKPEKDSKVGLVVTILITIILGAAAGTVAFLLLPK